MPFKHFFLASARFALLLTTAGALCCSSAWADTIEFKTGEKLKGLVVEEHEDRVIFSTADGEIQVLRKEIAKINFDEPSYTLLSMGRELERSNKLGEALSYYEKAAQLNPELAEAKTAAIGVRGKLWAGFTEGPVSEIQKQQEIQDAWRADTTIEEQAKRGEEEDETLLWKRMGVRLEKEGDFVKIADLRIGGYGHQAGLRAQDMIYSVDGQSMRYLQKHVVVRDFLEPRYASMSIEVRRKILIPAKTGRTDLKSLGVGLRQEYSGAIIGHVKAGSGGEKFGLKTGDRLVRVGENNTRYMPLAKIRQAFKTNQGKAFSLETGRTLQMARQ